MVVGGCRPPPVDLEECSGRSFDFPKRLPALRTFLRRTRPLASVGSAIAGYTARSVSKVAGRSQKVWVGLQRLGGEPESKRV